MHTNRREFLQSTIGAGLVAAAKFAAVDPAARAAEQSPLIDCHTHFYDPTRPAGVPWPGKGDPVLYRTILPKQFLEVAAPHGVVKTVVVEASPWVEDNVWLLDLAAKNSSIVGVVGNLTPGQPEFAQHLKRFAANRLYRGIRINHGLLRSNLDKPEFLADVRRLAEHDLELDVNGGPDTPADVARLADKLPDLRIVINHLANVSVDGADPPREWSAGMTAAAKHPRVFCKVSALVEHAKPKSANQDKDAPAKVPDDVEFYRPILNAIWNIFGDDRLIYGSNWPVSNKAAPYRTVFAIVDQYVQSRGREVREKYFWKNAKAGYQV